MMRERVLRVRALLRKEFRQLLRDPKSKRIVFGAPIVQLLMFGYAVTTDVHDVPMHVVDFDRTVASRELQQALTAGGYFNMVAVSERPAALAAEPLLVTRLHRLREQRRRRRVAGRLGDER